MKLLISAPQPDETITSVLDRAAALYATTRQELVEELGRSAHGYPAVGLDDVDLDVDPPREFLNALAKALGCPTQTINRLRLPAHDWLVSPGHRTAYCPNCFDEDLVTTGRVYLRQEWAYSFITHCRRHQRTLMSLPLSESTTRLSSARDLMTEHRLDRSKYEGSFEAKCWRECFAANPLLGDLIFSVRALWTRLCAFEAGLLASSHRSERSGDSQMTFYRDLVMLFCGNWAYIPMRPAVAFVTPYELTCDASILIDPKTTTPDFDIHQVWSYFLAQANPAWRRDIVWVLMQFGHAKGPVRLGAYRPKAGQCLVRLEKISRDQWFRTCHDRLPEYGQWLAQAFAARWPAPYRQVAAKIRTIPPHLDVETINKRRIEVEHKQRHAVRASIMAADRKSPLRQNMWKL